MNRSAIFSASEKYYIEVVTRDTGPIIIAIPYPLTEVTLNERIEVSDFNTNRDHPFYILHQSLIPVRYIKVEAMTYREGIAISPPDYVVVQSGKTIFLAVVNCSLHVN
jgi:hypothetical protein